ncbi:LOW QUALITY PROTEIN: dynein intermediate chain 2, ciliary-like [Paramacrobiotus metropolitanus]|uniref:LOW QUALITY PROTEIN: dynein intermediate chain 2, ciliary-like n=1 Tax=Paramacrobiotus metropolitanus TaxID=2943436 RepID=UPI0024462D37|nr:LOW QUALITY PROTEIN: dynein intermediate chain 2, ciliary-like [Paramacrobiotus metropolitanus]
MVNVAVEDHNPNSPVNVLKFTAKAGVVVELYDISQSEIVFYQKGSKIHKTSTKGAHLIEERAQRYPPGVDGLPTSGPKRRYNFIESIFRPQQIWPRHNYEIASQTESMPIGSFRVKVRTYAINDLYAADLKRKKTGDTEHGKGDPTQQSSIAMVTLSDAERLEKAKSDYQAAYKLVLVPMHHDIEDTKRKVADGAEWPVHIAPTKLIGLQKQRSIQHIFRGLKLVEKIILQAFHRPISVDYRYFEDLLDNGRKTGSLMPLWNIHHPRLKDVKLEFAVWHPRYPDMFVCSGGRDEVWDPLVGPGQTVGFVCWFSLRNPIYPEYLQYVAKPVMTFDIHPKGYIMAAGTNDGNIMYFNMGIRSDGPVAETNSFDEIHTRTIVAVKFLSENIEGDMRFFTVGLEGNYREWTIEKHTILPLRLILSSNMPGFFHNPNWYLDQPHTVAFSPLQKHLFLVGTLFGFVHLCHYDVFQHIQHSWRAHELPVAAVRWNPFHKDIFMTCGYDYKIQIYDLANIKEGPILKWNFDVGVRDVQWAPYNSMIFATLLTDGQFLMYDLAYSKYTPICSQAVAVTSKSRLERIRFNNWGPYVLISDQSGSVQIFKLSPNLRKIETQEEAVGTVQPKSRGAPVVKKKTTVRSTKYPGIDVKAQVAKAERLLAIFRDKVPPSLKLDAPMKKYITVGGESLSSVLPDGKELRLSGWEKSKDKGKDKRSF